MLNDWCHLLWVVVGHEEVQDGGPGQGVTSLGVAKQLRYVVLPVPKQAPDVEQEGVEGATTNPEGGGHDVLCGVSFDHPGPPRSGAR